MAYGSLFGNQKILEDLLYQTINAAGPSMYAQDKQMDATRIARALMMKFDIKISDFPTPLQYKCSYCDGAKEFRQEIQKRHFNTVKCTECNGKGYTEGLRV